MARLTDRASARRKFPRVLEGDRTVTVVLNGKRPVRSERRREFAEHYASNGSLARIEYDRKPPVELHEDPSRMWTSVRGAALELGVHPATARRLVSTGRLKARRLGNEWITTLAWIEEYRQTRRRPGRPRKTA